jgi:hypothetical protein
MMSRVVKACGLLVTLTAIGPACSQIAGIADYRNGVVDAGGGDSGDAFANSGSDGSSPDVTIPSCTDPEVALVIDVLSTSSSQYTGVMDNNGLFLGVLAVGQTFAMCVPKGTVLDLRVAPDDTDAIHDWGVCGMSRRCGMTVQQQTVLDVHL